MGTQFCCAGQAKLWQSFLQYVLQINGSISIILLVWVRFILLQGTSNKPANLIARKHRSYSPWNIHQLSRKVKAPAEEKYHFTFTLESEKCDTQRLSQRQVAHFQTALRWQKVIFGRSEHPSPFHLTIPISLSSVTILKLFENNLKDFLWGALTLFQ